MQINAISTSALTKPEKLAKIERSAREFEAMFATQMLSPMMESVGVNETMGGGHGEEVFRTMMVQEYGRAVANSGSLGLAQFVRQQMLQIQEIS